MSEYTNDTKKDIASVSEVLRVRDAFAEPRAMSYIPTDPAQLLIDDKRLRMRSYFVGGDVNKLSDYELFFEFVSNLDAMQGSAEKETFLEELKLLYSDCVLGNIADPKELWKSLCEKMSIENCNFGEKIKEISQYEKINSLRIFTNFDNFEKYSDFVEDQLEKIKNSDSEYAVADISVLNFSRTDDFHAATAYEKYRAGDSDAKSEALSGALYRTLSAIKNANKILLLNIGDNYSSAEQMIGYFRARDIMPSTVIFARDAARKSAERLCGVYKGARGEFSILSGVLCYEGDTVRDIKNRVLDISAVYPIGKLFIGGAPTESPFVAARHSILKRGIAEAICELSQDREEQLRIAEYMSK